MKRALQFVLRCTGQACGVAGSFALWTLWLALGLLLTLQLYVLTSSELAVPGFALRRIEARLAEAGLQANFSRATFDPTGRVLLENVKLSLPGIPDPIVTARSLFVRVKPWPLLVGSFEPQEIQLVGGTASVPAMFAPSGRPTEFLNQVEATLLPAEKTLEIRQLSARAAGIIVSARGTLVLERRTTPGSAGPPLAEFARTRFPAFCRDVLRAVDYASRFEQPELHLELAPSESGAAGATLTLLARRVSLDAPVAIQASGFRARTRLLLFGANPTSWLEFSLADARLPGGVRVRGLQGDVYGRFQDGAFKFEPRELTLTADAVAAEGTEITALSTQVYPRPLPRVDLEAVGRIAGAPLALNASADLEVRRASARFLGEISPGILDVLSRRLRVNVRQYFDFTSLLVERGEARFAPGWKFERLDAQVRVDGVNAYGVPMSDGRAIVELDPTRFRSPKVSARLGDNFAVGSYEQDLRTLEFRFLLDGRLRPLELSPWFRSWWPDFFRQLEFPVVPPTASVDVQGIWKQGHRTSVFVFADAAKPILRGAPFDRTLVRLFIRPGFYDGLQAFVTRGEGFARGRFAFVNSAFEPGWDSFAFAAESTFDLPTLTELGGDAGQTMLAPLRLSQAPALRADGRFRGPSSAQGPGYALTLHARTSGEFFYHDFPLHAASFTAQFKDDEVSIDDFEAHVAQGVATGHVRVWKQNGERRLGFDVALNDASLGRLAHVGQEFFARQKGLPPPPPDRFVQEKANVKLNLAASAEGRYGDPFSYRGGGSASLKGPEIAEIPLLGLLSELLKFTSLRFTEADANFRIEGAKVAFPEIKVRGQSAGIDAHGHYALDRRELDFNAKIFPFQESENLIKTVVGAVLMPFSNAFEVRLTGNFEKPAWALALGPTSFLRALAPGEVKADEKASPRPDVPAALPALPPAAKP